MEMRNKYYEVGNNLIDFPGQLEVKENQLEKLVECAKGSFLGLTGSYWASLGLIGEVLFAFAH